MTDGGEAGKGRRRVFGSKLRVLDKTDVDILQLKPLPEIVNFVRKPVCIPLGDAEGCLANSAGCFGDEPVGLQRSLPELWRSRCATPASPAVSCEGNDSSVCGHSGTRAIERSVAGAPGGRVDVAGAVAGAVPTGTACWVVRLLLLRLFPIGGLVGDAADTTTFTGGQRGRCISLQSGQGVDNRGGTCEGSDTSASWLFTAVADG